MPSNEHDDWRFSATVEVQPKPEPADWTQLEVPKHEAEVPEEAVQAELQAVQRTVGELVPVEGRPAAEGDTVVVDLLAEDGSSQRDYVVELGSERLVEEIEGAVRGLAPGEQREVAYELADGSRRTATVVLKEIKEHVLPPVDDELARSASEFETLAELRSEIEGRLRGQIEEELEGIFRAAAVDELVKASNVRARRTSRRAAHARASRRSGPKPRGARARRRHLPAADRPDRRAAQRASLRGSGVLGRAGADPRGGRRQARAAGDRRRDPRASSARGGESEEDIERFVADGGADRVRDDLRLRKALDRIAAEVKPIAPELHEARESIWTPGQEQPAEPAKLWTPGSQ